jgi:hypothetical protein
MKKLALFAMLLGSSFLFGCGETPKPKDKDKPAAGAAGDKKEGDAAKTDEAKTPDKDATTPAEPTK